ncbi:heparinase II/III family protein, partial [Blastomonas sp.]|uniref:heparinase II/III domain-containing protein n=1 Tax=Blastomonas sp. TaxID=1909299 RepID=UPI003594576A
LLADAGTPPVARHAINGCASTLAFEMSHASHRIIVNCGGAATLGGAVPQSLIKGLRATAAHSTLCLDDTNSTAVLPKGKLGKGVGLVEIDRRDLDDAVRLEMSHDGYAKAFGLIHRRILLLRPDGRELRGEDVLVPASRRGKQPGDVPYAIRFHLGLDAEAHLASDGLGVFLRIADGSLWQFRSMGDSVTLEDSLWVDEHARPQPSQQIVLSGTASGGGGSYGWLLKHMG